MASSKSSQTTRNIVIALLALWSVISLIIIVVWATSPDMKSASQCRAEMKVLDEELDETRMAWEADKTALEELVRQGWVNQTILSRKISFLMLTLRDTNNSLIDCEQENDLLLGNITALENEIEEHEQIEANLTSEIVLQKEHIDTLEMNLTQVSHHFESCTALRSAAESQQKAAESQKKACESSKSFAQRQLQRCKDASHNALKLTANRTPSIYSSPLVLLFCAIGLHLLSSCEYNAF